MVQKIDQDKLIVTQANKLAEASYTMTLEEKRIVLLMTSLVRQDDKDFQIYRIPITDIRDYLGLSTNKLYDDIKRVSDALMSRVLHIPEDEGGWLKVGWVSSARYIPKGKHGAECACIDLKFDPDLKPYLLELKSHFSNYMLQNVAGLRSFYSIRIYELLKSQNWKNGAVVFEIDELRRILKLEGKYENFKDFRIHVLLIAQRELAEKTDIAFDFEEKKKGRKVVSITFHIHENKPTKSHQHVIAKPVAFLKHDEQVDISANDLQPQLLPPTEADKEHARLYHEAIAEGVHNGVPEPRMREFLSTRNPAHVMENIEIARKRHMSTKGNGVDNLAGLTVSAITSDYAKEAREKRTAVVATRTKAQRKKEAADMLDRIHDAVQRQRRTETNRIEKEHGEGSPTQAAFEAELAGGSHAGMFQMRGWKMTGITPLWHGFLARRFLPPEFDQYRAHAATIGQDYDELCRLAGGR